MLEQIENLPVTLTNAVKTKVPVIEFFDNSSVICVWNKKRNCYEFAKKWNGVFGKDLFLSFENATPKLTDKFAKNRCSVVYDILQLLAAVPDENISIDSDWEFKVINNEKENDTVMVEYETHSAKKATSTPSHLMNLLLKEHFKVIKEETGGDLTEFGIYISGCCWFTSKARKILEKRFAEICENMKVKCEFIKFC
uniref:Uncharacterized protein n=1 Tax=Panagrolaimus superbus TaxID=310955 RepID=A0A914Y2G9_9BILA